MDNAKRGKVENIGERVSTMAKIVGYIDAQIIAKLELIVAPGTPILLGESNITHMRQSHPDAFDKYFDKLTDILSSPDYINKNPQDGSIKYIKRLEDHVVVGVRISAQGKVFARTIFIFTESKMQQYLQGGYVVEYK